MRTRGGVAQRELTATVASSGGPVCGGAPSSEAPSAVISTSGLTAGTLALFRSAGGASRRRSREKPCRSVARPTEISAMRMMTCGASQTAWGYAGHADDESIFPSNKWGCHALSPQHAVAAMLLHVTA